MVIWVVRLTDRPEIFTTSAWVDQNIEEILKWYIRLWNITLPPPHTHTQIGVPWTKFLQISHRRVLPPGQRAFEILQQMRVLQVQDLRMNWWRGCFHFPFLLSPSPFPSISLPSLLFTHFPPLSLSLLFPSQPFPSLLSSPNKCEHAKSAGAYAWINGGCFYFLPFPPLPFHTLPSLPVLSSPPLP